MEEAGLVSPNIIAPLRKEANELTAIFTAIGKTTKENQKNKKFKEINPKSNIRYPKL